MSTEKNTESQAPVTTPTKGEGAAIPEVNKEENKSVKGEGDGNDVNQDTVANKSSIDEKDKADWFETRLSAPKVDANFLVGVYGENGFKTMGSKEDYWEDKKTQEMFKESFGEMAHLEFEKAYEGAQMELAAVKMGAFKNKRSILDMARSDDNFLSSGLYMRDINTADNLSIGQVMTKALRDPREAAESTIRFDQKNADGSVTTEYEDYSIDKFKKMDSEANFEGFAYGDELYQNGKPALHVIQNGQIYSDGLGKWVDVRNDQIVSRWDINTGRMTDGWFDNNKLEADGFTDYLAVLGRSPMNMATNILDIFAQFGRAGVAGGYGVYNKFTGDNLNVREDDMYKWLTTAGIQIKGHLGSNSREAMTDGYWGSFEMFLGTTVDVALQVGLARALSSGAAMASGTIGETLGMTPKAVAALQQKSAGFAVKSVLMTMATKDSYNEALENGFNETEASVITGVMTVAMWHAAASAEKYIAGNFEAKAARKNIQSSLRNKLNDWFGSAGFQGITKGSTDKAKGNFIKTAYGKVGGALSEAFKKESTFVPSSLYRYAAQQEAIEEMTEELFQDLVKHGASAYGVLMKGAKEKGKGRYFTIFDDGYMAQAISRYGTSGVAGAMGGPMGMVGTSVNLRTISSTASVVDIIQAGKLDELIEVVGEMKANGELAPEGLSTEYDSKIKSFIPLIAGQDQTTLSDVVHTNILNDINVVSTFMKEGLFGQVAEKLKTSTDFKKAVERNSITKDFITLTGRILDLHTKTGMTTGYYQELDAMTEDELADVVSDGTVSKKLAEIQKQRDANKTISGDVTAADINKEKKEEEDKKKEESNKVDENGKPVVETVEKKESRLDREINLAPNANSNDVADLLDNYRKVRAMANGTASEYYLMQNELTQDDTYGAMEYRAPEHKVLGDTPFIDEIMALRVKSVKLEKEHEYKKKKSLEVEEQLTAITQITPETLRDVTKIFKESSDILSKKSIKMLIDLGKNVDYSAIEAGLDPNGASYIFENDGEARQALVELIKLDPDSAADIKQAEDDGDFEVTEFLDTTMDMDHYFGYVSSDVSSSRVPAINMPSYEDMGDGGAPAGATLGSTTTSLVDNIKRISKNTPAGAKLVDLFNSLPQEVYDYRALINRTVTTLAVFNPSDFDPTSIDHMFNISEVIPGGLTVSSMSVADAVSSQVKSLVSSSVDGDKLFGLRDKASHARVVKQLKQKLAFADKFERFMPSNHPVIGSYYPNMLAKFRMNTLSIMKEGMYDPHASIDTLKERHPYKDFTSFSDMFVDYLYDPIRMQELLAMEPSMRGVDEAAELTKMHVKKAQFQTFVTYQDKFGEDVSTFIEPDIDAIKMHLDIQFSQLGGVRQFQAAEKVLSAETIELPKSILGLEGTGVAVVELRGATKLKLMEWLLDGVGRKIDTAVDANSESIFFTEKKKDIKSTFQAFDDLFSDEKLFDDAFRSMLDKEIPGWETAMTVTPEFSADADYVVVGKLNIEVEKFLYNLYSGKIDTGKYNVDKNQSVDGVMGHLKGLAKKNILAADASKFKYDYTTILTALTTDLTPFYSELKSIIGNLDIEKDVIVTAPQENAAKYAAAAIYSNNLLDEHTRIMRDVKGAGFSANGVDIFLNTLYVTGAAGSGKTSAVTDLGMTIANNILEENGAASKVLAVSNNTHQIKRLAESIGDRSIDGGSNVADALNLLEDAVLSKDPAAIDKLNNISAIVIDEVTYVDFSNGSKSSIGYDTLNKINDTITLYNKHNRSGKNKLSLVVLGDSEQGKATKVVDNAFASMSLQQRYALPTKYMEYSHRAKNSFMIDSMAAIRVSKPKISAMGGTDTTAITIGKGSKWGLKDGIFYGVNIRDTSKPGSEAFMDDMKNTSMVTNIKENMDKAIASKSEFTVLIVPETLDTFLNNTSPMLELYNNPKYQGFFRLRSVADVGGSEANYVFAEMPDIHIDGVSKDMEYVDAVYTLLNTIASRAINYSSVINRSPGVVITKEAKSKRIDNQVMMPSAKMEKTAKERVKQLYMDILSDVKGAVTINTDNTDGAVDGFTDVVDMDIIEDLTQEHFEKLGAELAQSIADLDIEGLTNSHSNNDIQRVIDSLSIVHEMYQAIIDGDESINTTQEDIQNLMDDLGASDVALYDMLSSLMNTYLPDGIDTFSSEAIAVFDIHLQNVIDMIEGYHRKLDKDKTTNIYDVALIADMTVVDIFDGIVQSVNDSGGKSELTNFIRTGKFEHLKFYLDAKFDKVTIAEIEKIFDGTYVNDALTEDEAKAIKGRLFTMLSVLNAVGTLQIADGTKKPDIEIGNPLLTELKYFLFSASTTSLEDTLNAITANAGKTISIPKAASPTVETLMDNFSQRSVMKSIKSAIENVLTKKKYINGLEGNLAAIQTLRSELNINGHTDPIDLFTHVLALKDDAITRIADDDMLAHRTIYFANRLLQVIADVHRDALIKNKDVGRRVKDDVNSFFYYYNRGKAKYTLSDYMNEQDSAEPHKTYSVDVPMYIKEQTLRGTNYETVSKAERTDFLGFTGDGTDTIHSYTGTEILVVKSKDKAGRPINITLPDGTVIEKFEILVVAVNDTGTKKKVFGRYNTEFVSGRMVDSKVEKMVAALSKDPEFANLAPGQMKAVKVQGEPKNNVHVRAGKFNADKKGVTLAAMLQKSPVSTAKNIYVLMKSESLFSGELFLPYTWDSKADIDSNEMKKKLGNEGYLGRNRRVKTDNGITSEIGIMPVNLRIPFKQLTLAMNKPGNTIKLATYTSMLSLTLQKYFVDSLSKMSVGDTLKIPGVAETLTVSQELKSYAAELQADYDISLKAGKTDAEVTDTSAKVEAALKTIRANSSLDATVTQLLGIQLQDVLFADPSEALVPLLYKNKSGFTVFNVSKITKTMKGATDNDFSLLDALADLTGYEVRPEILATDAGSSDMTARLSPDFVAEFKDFINIPATSIDPGGFVMDDAIMHQVIGVNNNKPGDNKIYKISSADTNILNTSLAFINSVSTSEETMSKSATADVDNEFNITAIEATLNNINALLAKYGTYLDTNNKTQKQILEKGLVILSDRVAAVKKGEPALLSDTSVNTVLKAIAGAKTIAEVHAKYNVYKGAMSFAGDIDFYNQEDVQEQIGKFIASLATSASKLPITTVQTIIANIYGLDKSLVINALLENEKSEDFVNALLGNEDSPYKTLLERKIKSCL